MRVAVFVLLFALVKQKKTLVHLLLYKLTDLEQFSFYIRLQGIIQLPSGALGQTPSIPDGKLMST